MRFASEIVIDARQAHQLADGVSDAEGAMAEPLAVALHAVNRAGPLLGKSVLVTGCGPIGAMVVIAARRAGAALIVATDVVAQPLRSAPRSAPTKRSTSPSSPTRCGRSPPTRAGSTCCSRPAATSARCAPLRRAAAARRDRAAGPVGRRDDAADQHHRAKEFDLRGTFRFHEEFGVAVELINQGLVDLKPLISATLPYRDAGRAFALAADRSQSMKVLLDFD